MDVTGVTSRHVVEIITGQSMSLKVLMKSKYLFVHYIFLGLQCHVIGFRVWFFLKVYISIYIYICIYHCSPIISFSGLSYPSTTAHRILFSGSGGLGGLVARMF